MNENKLDREDVLDIFKGEELKFDHYYKYTFYFKGEKDGYKITASVGGRDGDIYRMSISHDETKTFEKFKDWNFVSVEKDDEKVFSEQIRWV